LWSIQPNILLSSKGFGPAVHNGLGHQLSLTVVRLSFLHLYRGLGAAGVVFGCIIGAVKASMKHEYTAEAQAHTQLFHDRLPASEFGCSFQAAGLSTTFVQPSSRASKCL